MKLAILSNRYSDRNGGQSQIAAFCAAQADVSFYAPAQVDDIAAALTDFARAGIDVLAIDGGDGTIRDVLTRLPAAFGARLPALALLPSGKTNLIARDVGSFGSGVKGVTRLLRAWRQNTCIAHERAMLEADRGADWPLVRGMFFGAGIFAFATRMAAVWTFGRGIKQNAGVALTIARVVWRHWCGRDPGVTMAIPSEAAPAPQFVVLATTLQRLMLGFWPFPRSGEGDLKWLAVAAPSPHLLGALWAAWRGRLVPKPGYRGGQTMALGLYLTTDFVVDGEIYPPGPEGVILRAGPTVRFLSLRR